MIARYDVTEITSIEEALHDTLLAFNGDLAECVIAVAANADITFKQCQVLSPTQKALQDGHATVEMNLQEFLHLLSGMVQIVDGHVSITLARGRPTDFRFAHRGLELRFSRDG